MEYQKITKVSKNSQQNNLFEREIPKERYIAPEERQKIIDNLGIITIV